MTTAAPSENPGKCHSSCPFYGGKDRSTRHPEKTTYVLGAGFSSLAGIPLMGRFIPAAFELLKQRTKDKEETENRITLVRKLADLIDRKRSLAASADIQLDNIEQLFCLVERQQDEEDRKTLRKVILETLRLAHKKHMEGHADRTGDGGNKDPIRQWTRDWADPFGFGKLRCRVPQRHLFADEHLSYSDRQEGTERNICVYDAFVSYVLDAQLRRLNASVSAESSCALDAIVTSNYDLVIEETMAKFTKAWVFYQTELSVDSEAEYVERFKPARGARWIPLPLVKIHGSINWWKVPGNDERAKRSVHLINPFPIDAKSFQLPEVSAEKLLLVPPVLNKQPASGDLFGHLAEVALHHLRTAARIVVIGYSMPISDAYMRYLIAEGLDTPERPEIEVWDVIPKTKMADAIKGMFGTSNLESIKYDDGGITKFVRDKINPHSMVGRSNRQVSDGISP